MGRSVAVGLQPAIISFLTVGCSGVSGSLSDLSAIVETANVPTPSQSPSAIQTNSSIAPTIIATIADAPQCIGERNSQIVWVRAESDFFECTEGKWKSSGISEAISLRTVTASPTPQTLLPIIFGSGAPTPLVGAAGQSYLNTESGEFYQKSATGWGEPLTSLRGAPGPQGEMGTPGFMGLMGPQGPAGAAGATGAQGASGPQGVAGATGATGATGPAGATGAQGPQGLQGIQGIQGAQGPAGQISFASVTSDVTLQAGYLYHVVTSSGPRLLQMPLNPSVGDKISVVTDSTTPVDLRLGSRAFGGRPVTTSGFEGRARLLTPKIVYDLIYSGASQGWIPSADGAFLWYQRDPNLPNRSAIYNNLTYTPSVMAGEPYTSGGITLSRLKDGNFLEGIYNTAGIYSTLKINFSFSVPVFFNKIRIANGQFNGCYNWPTRMRIYEGSSDTGRLLSTHTSLGCTSGSFSEIDLSMDMAYDLNMDTLTIVFDMSNTGGTGIHVAELEFQGHLP
jgi:hypothetical protein